MKIQTKYFIFIFSSIFGLFLAIQRYPFLWPSFPQYNYFWKVYVDHFVAGFLLPIWFFIILAGPIILFNKKVDIEKQKLFIFLGFLLTIIITLIWDFIIPLGFLISYSLTHNLSFTIIIQVLKLLYWSPRYEIIQFVFDWLGIFISIIFIKSFREDFK